MAQHPNFRPTVGVHWRESLSNDKLILNELERLGLSRHLRQSKEDLTVYGKNKRLVLRHITGQALLVWEKQRLSNSKYGIRCVLFVNNSQIDSKTLLDEAMKLARLCWIEYSFFAEIEPKLFPRDADEAFLKCGWKQDGLTANKAQVYKSDFGL